MSLLRPLQGSFLLIPCLPVIVGNISIDRTFYFFMEIVSFMCGRMHNQILFCARHLEALDYIWMFLVFFAGLTHAFTVELNLKDMCSYIL